MTTTDHTALLASAPRSRGVRWTITLFAVVIVVSLIAGIAAALFGGSLTDLGKGAGGLYGLPSLLTTVIALFAIPVSVGLALAARGSPHWLRSAIVFGAGAWVVALGYFMIAHAVDPCVNGWWDANSRIGDQRLCERFGDELNWHTRYHLLAHAAPAAALLAIYMWSVRRWATPADPTAEHLA